METSFVIKGNVCQTKNAHALDLHENAFAVYLGLDEKNITAKYVTGRKVL